MKKLSRLILAVTAAISFFALSGCNDAIVDDGSDPRNYATAGGSGNALFASNYAVESDFKIYSWGDPETVALSEASGGGMRITVKNSGGWFGAGIAQQDAKEGTPDLTFANGVKKIVLEVRGNLKANFYYICPNDGEGATNDPYSIKPDSEVEWQKIEIDITKNGQVSTALAINQGTETSWTLGSWIEVRNIDWVDANDLPVSILK